MGSQESQSPQHLSLLLSHRSVRGYRPDALPSATLETLVAAAQSAAGDRPHGQNRRDVRA
jgi:nitroreductase